MTKKPIADRDTIAAVAAANTELVDLLGEMYPEKAPNPIDPEREIWMKAGERRLVEKMILFRDEGLKNRAFRPQRPA